MAKLKAAIVNPADKYKEKGEALHKYGQYLMSCLPKYVQQCVSRGSRPCLV
jgi:NADH dehydrogenase (ubiquinone) Fe-S protein 3